MPDAIDPVRDAAAYQQLLLSKLGADDPAEAQEQTSPQLRTLLEEAGADLRTRPEPEEWSVQECIGHILDAELVTSARHRWILAQDQPVLVPYDQDRWVARLRHDAEEPEALLALFDALRVANLDLWRRTSPADRARVGLHQERGPESYDLSFRMIAGHDRLHVAQAREALRSVRG